MDDQTRTYLDLYSRLEKAIRDKYPVPDGDGAVAWLARNERGYRGIANELDYCREVRNLLQHNELVNDDYAVVPSAGMMECLRDALSRVLDVPTAGGICVKTQQLYAAGIHDRIRPAMRAMVQNAYAYVPILEDGRVQGVFSESTLLAYMNTDEVVEIAEEDTFEKVRDLLPLDRHGVEKFAFVEAGMLATDIAELFQAAQKRRERLGMVFVTANGKQRERLLGILTAWDMAAFF